jgi:Acetyltransferase (GNAT) family
MSVESICIRIRGEDVAVPALTTENYTLMSTGSLPRIAQLFDEELLEAARFPDPYLAIRSLRDAGLPADIFTFSQPFRAELGALDFHVEADNLAVVSTASYDDWWSGLPQESRKNVRLAAKRGVVAKSVEFDDLLVTGIKSIYDETPVRQGRQFWHYQRDFERVKMLNATYLDRSHFVGAYIGEELIGFIKYIKVDQVAVLIQILAKESHRDKRAISALLRQTIELCHQQGLKILTYGKFDYGVNQDSSLTEFKRRNGFSELTFPRYFVPLTAIGRSSLAVGLHLGWRNLLPPKLRTVLHRARSRAMRALHKPSAKGTS